jgi:esterase/lipase
VFAPALIIPGAWKANLFKYLFFGLPKKNLSPVKDGYLPWQGYKTNPLRAVSELLKLQKLVRKLLSNINQPGLIFQGLRDETIDPAGSQIIYNAIHSKNKDLIYLPNCGHALLLDKEYSITYEKSVRFLI